MFTELTVAAAGDGYSDGWSGSEPKEGRRYHDGMPDAEDALGDAYGVLLPMWERVYDEVYDHAHGLGLEALKESREQRAEDERAYFDGLGV